MKNKRICVGYISSPHGILGAVRIDVYTDSLLSFLEFKKFYTEDDREIILSNPRINESREREIISRILGFKDRTDIERSKICRQKIYVNRDDLPDLQDDEYYFEDLKGLCVKNKDLQNLGVVNSVMDFGGGVFLDISLENSKKEATLPFNKNSVIEVFIDKGYIIIDERYLLVS